MRVTMEAVFIARPSFGQLLNAKGMKSGDAIKVARMAKQVINEYGLLNDRRNKILNDLGKKQPNGTYSISEEHENWDVFQKEITDLLKLEIDIPLIEKITIPGDIEISPQALLDLEPFIDVA